MFTVPVPVPVPVLMSVPVTFVMVNPDNNQIIFNEKTVQNSPPQNNHLYSGPVDESTRVMPDRALPQRELVARNTDTTFISQNSEAQELFKMLDDIPTDGETHAVSDDSEYFGAMIDDIFEDIEWVKQNIDRAEKSRANPDFNDHSYTHESGIGATQSPTKPRQRSQSSINTLVANCFANGDMKTIFNEIEDHNNPDNKQVIENIKLLLNNNSESFLDVFAFNITKKIFQKKDYSIYNKIMANELFSKLRDPIIKHMDSHLRSVPNRQAVWLLPNAPKL